METYLGQIQLFGFNFAPRGWAFCDGRLLSISQNSALFSLLGTMYGGDGQTTFGLPDLRGRVAIGMGQAPGGSNYTQGQVAGVEYVTLNMNQMPAHNHFINVSNVDGTSNTASGNFLAAGNAIIERSTKVPANIYGTSLNAAMNSSALSIQGGSQPHDNMQPYLVLNYCIALQGIYPSRN